MSDKLFLAVCVCLVSFSTRLCRDDIVEWVSRALNKIIGMEVYWQNYTVQVPVASSSKVEETWEREWEGRREGRGAEREREREGFALPAVLFIDVGRRTSRQECIWNMESWSVCLY